MGPPGEESTKIISIVKWIRTSRLSIKNALSLSLGPRGEEVAHVEHVHDGLGDRGHQREVCHLIRPVLIMSDQHILRR